MKLSNYSLNYPKAFADGQMDVFGFLSLCRQLGVDGASLHPRQLAGVQTDYLKRIRRAYLDHGLTVSMFTVTTNFGVGPDKQEEEHQKGMQAVRAALLLGAPLLRVFAGSPSDEADRPAAWKRAVAGVRKLCEEAAREGLPIGLQNHNHGALCRTGDEVLRFLKAVDHPNLVFVLDTGQFAGSRGASGPSPPELRDADYLASIRQTASLARYVRVKFYNPRPDGSEPFIDYLQVFDILRGVHYGGFIDIVYEPGAGTGQPGEDVRTALPRVVPFLRARMRPDDDRHQQTKPHVPRYAEAKAEPFFAEPLRTETAVAFLEGPTADRQGNVYFSDIPMERILRWDPTKRELTVFREKSNAANGLRFDREGRLLACEGGKQERGRVTRTDLKTGQVAILADQFDGHALGAPNDLELDGKGRIYFTSRLTPSPPTPLPQLGDKEAEGRGKGNVNAVYRIDPDGAVSRVLAAPQIDMPNGIALSPDDKILYLIDADGRAQRARRIRAYDLKPDGTVANERTLYDFYPGRSGDGMKMDAEGNLYVAAGLHRPRGSSETLDTRPGIHVITPRGKLAAFIETPEDAITNCAFGGPDLRTLYITCGKLLLSVRTKLAGKRGYRPEM